MNRTIAAAVTLVAASLATVVAYAHVGVTSGPGVANATQELTFGIGHGCAGADTYSVKIDVPAGVTSVRPLATDFGPASIQKDAMGNVTSVTWQKPDDKVLPDDSAYYKLGLRLKLPNQPFTKIYFPAHQVCKGADGGTSASEWTATEESLDGGGPEPAPVVIVRPARQPGWNKVTVPQKIADLKEYFADAAIVWRGNSAYSANTSTAELIAGTAGVSVLTSIEAGSEIWVKY